MHYLIDGHNFIGEAPDMDLADPDDEAKLVQRLKQFTMNKGHKCTVIFDAGLPGGPDRVLSSSKVKVIFAPSSSSADALIKSRIKNQISPGGWTVVSADHEIVAAALNRRIKVLSPRAFAEAMKPQPAAVEDEKNPDVRLSPDQVDEWARWFKEQKKKRK